MHLLLRNLVSWQRLHNAEPGYTVVIASMAALAPLVAANLRLAARQSSWMRELILVIDCPADRIPETIHAAVRECSEFMSIRVLGYTDWQQFVGAGSTGDGFTVGCLGAWPSPIRLRER